MLKRFLGFWPVFLIFILSILFNYKIILNSNQILSGADIAAVFSPTKLFISEYIKQGLGLPLWNPYVFSGTPLLANPASGILYPLNLIFLIFNPDFAFGYLYTIDIFLIGLFTYFYSRTIKLDKFSSLVSALVFMFSGTVVSRIYPGHLFIVDAIVWFPLLLTFYEYAVQRKEIIYGILSSIPIGLMILVGHTQITAYALLFASLYFVLRSFQESGKNFQQAKKLFLIFIISIALGISLSAVQLFPTLEFSKLSARSLGASFDFAQTYSLYPHHLITFLIPNFFGSTLNQTYWDKGNIWELCGYVGILPLILVFIAILYKRDKYVKIFFLLGLFSLIYSLGSYTPLFKVFFDYVPFFNNFRVPARMLFIYAFSISILTGVGVQFLLKNTKISQFIKKITYVKYLLLFLTSLLSLSILLIYLNNGFALFVKYVLRNSYAVGINRPLLYHQLLTDTVIFIFFCFAGILILHLATRKRINLLLIKALIIVVTVSDLWIFGLSFIQTDYPENIYQTPDTLKLIEKDKSRFRILDMTNIGFINAIAAREKIDSLTGVDSLYVRDYRDFLLSVGKHEDKPYESFFQIYSIDNSNILNLLNTKYIISDKKMNPPNFTELFQWKKKIYQSNEFYVYQNKSVLPRAYIVPNALVSKNNTLNMIAKGNVNLKNTVILEKNPDVPLSNNSTYKEIAIGSYSPNKISMNFKTDDPGFLVLSEAYYPGWKAYDNDKEIPVLKADYTLRSVYVTKGTHNISFIYKPLSLKIGALISLVSICTLCISLLYFFREKVFIFFRKYKLKLLRRP